MAIKDNEAVYDEKIHPLMKQVLDICKEYDIPMFATFQYGEDENGGLVCTSVIGKEGQDRVLTDCYRVAREGWQATPGFSAFTITTVTKKG